jgi:thymidylate synthase (FAD)
MNKIQVKVLNVGHENPEGMMLFLAKLTQRGHKLSNMQDLEKMYNECIGSSYNGNQRIKDMNRLPHGTIKRFSPITVAVVGASRRFLAQIRTHQVGVDFVSASLQYSDYSTGYDVVVPYSMLDNEQARKAYKATCDIAMDVYSNLQDSFDITNDEAGYVAPQGLRNILIIQANHEAWNTIINKRACNRNTVETQYVMCKIWEELLETHGGSNMFAYAGPDCIYGICREGKMCCGNNIEQTHPTDIIEKKWP